MAGRILDVQVGQLVANGQAGRGPAQPVWPVDFGAVTEAAQDPVVQLDQRRIAAPFIEGFEQLGLKIAAEATHLTQGFKA